MSLISLNQYLAESDSLELMKQAANKMAQSFRFARSEGLNDLGRWVVFVGENDPKLLDASLKAMGFEFYTFTDELGGEQTGWMDDYCDLQIIKASRIVAAGTVVGYELSIYADMEDVDALGLSAVDPQEGSGDGDSQDDSFTDNTRTAR